MHTYIHTSSKAFEETDLSQRPAVQSYVLNSPLLVIPKETWLNDDDCLYSFPSLRSPLIDLIGHLPLVVTTPPPQMYNDQVDPALLQSHFPVW